MINPLAFFNQNTPYALIQKTTSKIVEYALRISSMALHTIGISLLTVRGAIEDPIRSFLVTADVLSGFCSALISLSCLPPKLFSTFMIDSYFTSFYESKEKNLTHLADLICMLFSPSTFKKQTKSSISCSDAITILHPKES